jgi:hypothetical protein
MAAIGIELETVSLVLTKGRDFRWSFENLNANRQPIDYPAGDLYFEFALGDPPTKWEFVIDGSLASLKVESTAVDLIPERTKWQLVFLPEGESVGGDPIARGQVRIQL